MTDTAPRRVSRKSAVDLPGMAPLPESFSTRADLLKARADAWQVLHRADMSARRATKSAGLVLLSVPFFALLSAAFQPPDDISTEDPGTFGLVFGSTCGLTGAILSLAAFRLTVRAREVGRRARSWRDLADQQAARALPAGEIPADLREPFDARYDSDFERHATTARVHLQVAPWEDRVLFRAALAGLGTGLSIALLLIGFGNLRTPYFTGVLVAGLVLGVACGTQWVKAVRYSWLETKRWWRWGREFDTWRAERAARGL